MSATAHAVLAVGGAVLAPSLLDAGARATGTPIPAYVTWAGAQARASLSAPILAIGPQPGSDPRQANQRYLSVRRALIPLRGALGVKGNYAKLSADDASAMLGRFIAACVAGVSDDEKESFRLAESIAPLGLEVSADIASNLAAGEVPPALIKLTDLGRALLAAGQERARIVALYGAVFDPIRAQDACGRLAIEMDYQGYLESGEPISPSIVGGLGAALDASIEFVAGVPVKLAGVVGSGVANVVLSTPGLLLVGGLIVWRATR